MSPLTTSRPSQNASDASGAANPHTSTSAELIQCQFPQTATAQRPPYTPWLGATDDDSLSQFWKRYYKPIRHYNPPAPRSCDAGPTESLEPLTQQRKRPADSAASFEPAKISRADTRHKSPPTTTAERYVEASIAEIFRRRRAEIRAKEEVKGTAEDQQRDVDATATYHRETLQATAHSNPSAHASGVSATGQGYERQQPGSGSSRLDTKQIRPGSQYQEHIPLSVPPISTYSAPRYKVPHWAGEFGAQGRDWTREKGSVMETGMKKPGQSRFFWE